MTVFEYSSVLMAIIIGMTVNELLQRITNILSRENGLALYWYEAIFTIFMLTATIAIFFGYFGLAGGTDRITVTMFLGPFTTICVWYILIFFFPVPKKEDGAIDIEAHFISKVPRWAVFTGLFMIVQPFANLTMDSDISLLFISASIQNYLGGLLMTSIGILTPIIVSRIGIRRFKLFMVALSVPWNLIYIANSFYTLS